MRHEGRGEQREAPSVESRDGGHRDGDRADGRADAYRAPAEDRSYRERGRNDGYRGDNHGSYDRRSYDRGRGSVRQYRDNDRVNMQGHISRYAHERGGYRVWLDNGPYAFWVPEARWRNNWRVGIGINIGGIFRAGTIYADVYDDPYYNDPYYNDAYGYRGGYAADYLTGYVDRIDYRTATMWLRDDRSGRIVTVDMRAVDGRYSRLDSRDLRRGDRVTFTGAWLRPGIFSADRIDSVDTGRY